MGRIFCANILLDRQAMDSKSNTGFANLGLELRICRALRKLNLTNPMRVQQQVIPEILQGKDVICRAPTGSGKTLAYLLPAIHHLITVKQTYGSTKKVNVRCLILVPTKDLCEQVRNVTVELLAKCSTPLPVAAFTSALDEKAAAALFNGSLASPSILIATPGRLAKALNANDSDLGPGLEASLEILVLDEADLLISYGYENDLKRIAPIISRKVHTNLFAATISSNVDAIKDLILKNPILVDLCKGSQPDENNNDLLECAVPKGIDLIKHSFLFCGKSDDKLVHILAILRLGLVERKVLIFAAGIDSCYRIRLFLEAFGIRSAVVHNQLPIQSRQHIVASFNAALIDYLIAAVADQEAQQIPSSKRSIGKKSKSSDVETSNIADPEFGITRGIDFRDVRTVINYDVPTTGENYIHRAGRTGRSGKKGHCLTIVSSSQKSEFLNMQTHLLPDGGIGSSAKATSAVAEFVHFDAITKSIVDSLRYRAEDIARGISRRAIRDARAKELRNELLNSEKLKSLWIEKPTELEFLKHDKPLSQRQAPAHLKQIPSYLKDPSSVAVDKEINPSPKRKNRKRKMRSLLVQSAKAQADPLKSLALSSDNRDVDEGSNHTGIGFENSSMAATWASKRRKLALKTRKSDKKRKK